MKTASVDITVVAKVNGIDVPCELSKDAKVIIDGTVTIKNVELTPNN